MPAAVARKLAVEVADARDLVPKDGHGTSSPYVVVDFAGQRKRTRTCPRDLNPAWHERLEFIVPDPARLHDEELDVEVFSDCRPSAGGGKRNHFLGRVRIYGSQFPRRGEEGLVYFPLERRSLLSWVRGELGLKVYYYDDPVEDSKKPDEPPAPATTPVDEPPKDVLPDTPLPMHTETIVTETQLPATVRVVVMEEPRPLPTEESPETRRALKNERPRTPRRTGSENRHQQQQLPHIPMTIPNRFVSTADPPESATAAAAAYDLVEPMQYLFVRVVRARGLAAGAGPGEQPYIKLRSGVHELKSNPGRRDEPAGGGCYEWNQVFALSMARPEATLEISAWVGGDVFAGGLCFDLADVPVRDQPDAGPLAPQWYRLEGGGGSGGDQGHPPPTTSSPAADVMVAVWLGTQSDEAFPESRSSDAPHASHTRPKVYHSPKLWYLRATVIEAQDLRLPRPVTGAPIDVRVKVQLDFQSLRTRRSAADATGTSFSWAEDLLFVASEPLEDTLIVLVEDRSTKDPSVVGHVSIPVAAAEQRLDERHPVPSRWFALDPAAGSSYSGRIHLRLCLEGGYHVLDEVAHACSDFRPTAKQLWKPPIGALELGIIGARGLLPMKTTAAGGLTDAYCVAKYGRKWVRTRTVPGSLDPRWNEQYTWQVYDPSTVLTVGVFDDRRTFAGGGRPDARMGKVRIRVSALEGSAAHQAAYPLVVLQRRGAQRTGELHLAVRFTSPAPTADAWAAYLQPTLPRAHYLRPIGVAQQEALRAAAARIAAAWFRRAEPPLGAEVVTYILDADATTQAWSLRRCKANWFRLVAVLAWALGLARWMDGIRRWRSPTTTVLVHALYLVLIWYPELIAPTTALYLAAIAAWYRRFRPRGAAGVDARLSIPAGGEDDLDEEFDPSPSAADGEVVRARYDRLRALAVRVQAVVGDVAAQGERVQALVCWRDPRATKMFIGACMGAAVGLYVFPPKMVAVALGFYYLRHPMFRDPMPPAFLNFFRRLPSLSDRLL